MGLANLVPGISGGTMLLASGVYPRFVAAVAELSTLRLRGGSLALLGSVAGSAGVVILLLAGPTKHLVVAHRWAMYSLFIGLTLGGVPLVWRAAARRGASFATGAAIGVLAMGAMAWLTPDGSTATASSAPALLVAGVAGAAAMVLPGVSGGYLLLVLGQYVPILSGIDALKRSLLPLAAGGPPDAALLAVGLHVAVPVGAGVGLGIAAVSNLVRWTLRRFPTPTLGVLLGLLLGAVLGLWPFQRSVPPPSAATSDPPAAIRLDPDRWPLERFWPSPAQAGASAALVLFGFAVTRAIGQLGDPGDAESG